MSQGATIDFSKYEQQAPIDFSKYEKPQEQQQAAPDQFAQDRAVTEAWAQNHKILGPIARFLVAGGQNAASAITDTPSALYHAITDPPTPEESSLSPEQRVIARLGPEQAAKAAQSYSSGEVTPKGAASVLPEALGTGLGQVAGGAVYGKGGEIAGQVGPAAAQAAAPAVRAGARASNQILAKAPGTIGGTAGATLGGYLGGHVGAEIGGVAGAVAGRELLPQVHIPGEGFGFPRRVTGGPANAPPYEAPLASGTPGATPTTAENVPVKVPAKVGPPTTTLANLKPAEVQAAANQAVGYEPPKPGVPIGQQGLPPGHTAVESSAVRSYKYDPDTRSLEVHPTSGTTTYRYGDVSPEQAADFRNAKSIGKAWQTVRESGSPLVAKRVNGKWVPVKPAQPTATLGDLTDVLQQSLEQAKSRARQ